MIIPCSLIYKKALTETKDIKEKSVKKKEKKKRLDEKKSKK